MEIYNILGRFSNVEDATTGGDKSIVREWSARCPVHDDRRNSLYIGQKTDGKIMIHCQAGCDNDRILAAAGLTYADLFTEKKSPKQEPAKREAVYDYPDEARGIHLRKIRMRNPDGSKSFFWQRDEAGEWKNGRAGIDPPLYGLQYLSGHDFVFVAEGEKDADNMNRLEYPCVSLPDGAKRGAIPWPSFYDDSFRGRSVYIIPDNDDVGRAFAELEAEHVQAVADQVFILDLREAWPEIPEKGDISDLIAALGDEAACRMIADLEKNAKPWAGSQHDPEQEPKPSRKLTEYEPIVKQLEILKPEQEPEFNDQMMGRLFASIFRPVLRYNVTAKEWYFYNGRYWQIDTGGMIAHRKAKTLVDALLVYSSAISARDFTKFVVKYGSLKMRKTMVEDARSECFISNSDFDRNGDLLNCQNGTFNLRTMELQPFDPEDLISKCSNIEYDPSAQSETFEKYISEIMEENPRKILYLQKTLGLALTTDTSLETMWIWYGKTTRNGKGTLAETIAFMLGNSSGYALAMAPETLAQRKTKDTRQASGDIARLNGCRFLNASEPPKRMLFDAALLKTLLGRDTIVARNLMEKEFEFVPQFKLFINTNHLPRIQDDTLFTSGRINVLTFDRHFSEEEQDPDLKNRLQKPENISGIFNWCLDGLRLFRETGLDPPDEVRFATADYRENSDKIASFITECMEKTGKNSAAGIVYHRFATWCSANGYGTDSKSSFFDELKTKGIFMDRGMVNGVQTRNIIAGYELIDEPETELP